MKTAAASCMTSGETPRNATIWLNASQRGSIASGLACISARGLFCALLTVATMASVQAQVTVVSNLGENAWGGSSGLSQHIRYPRPFTTDNSASAWTLNSLTVHLDGSDNPSGDFFVEIWSSSSGQPGVL